MWIRWKFCAASDGPSTSRVCRQRNVTRSVMPPPDRAEMPASPADMPPRPQRARVRRPPFRTRWDLTAVRYNKPASARAARHRRPRANPLSAGDAAGGSRHHGLTMRPCSSACATVERRCRAWKLPEPWTPKAPRRSWENAQTAFFTPSTGITLTTAKRSDHLSNASRQIASQQQRRD